MKEKSLILFKKNIFTKVLEFFKKFIYKNKNDKIENERELINSEIISKKSETIEKYDIEYLYNSVKNGNISLDDLTMDDYISIILRMNTELENKENIIKKEKKVFLELDNNLKRLYQENEKLSKKNSI